MVVVGAENLPVSRGDNRAVGRSPATRRGRVRQWLASYTANPDSSRLAARLSRQMRYSSWRSISAATAVARCASSRPQPAHGSGVAPGSCGVATSRQTGNVKKGTRAGEGGRLGWRAALGSASLPPPIGLGAVLRGSPGGRRGRQLPRRSANGVSAFWPLRAGHILRRATHFHGQPRRTSKAWGSPRQ